MSTYLLQPKEKVLLWCNCRTSDPYRPNLSGRKQSQSYSLDKFTLGENMSYFWKRQVNRWEHKNWVSVICYLQNAQFHLDYLILPIGTAPLLVIYMNDIITFAAACDQCFGVEMLITSRPRLPPRCQPIWTIYIPFESPILIDCRNARFDFNF